MFEIAAISLAVAGLLSVAAVVSCSWSVVAATSLLRWAIALAAGGALAVVLAGGHGRLAGWAFLFACGSCSWCVNAARKLFDRSARWVHRFVIYAGYGATFATMGAAGLWLEVWAASGRVAAGVFIGTYIVGSAFIFLAKTRILRLTAKSMPEYHASVAADLSVGNDRGYW
jgi:hypothetical protein